MNNSELPPVPKPVSDVPTPAPESPKTTITPSMKVSFVIFLIVVSILSGYIIRDQKLEDGIREDDISRIDNQKRMEGIENEEVKDQDTQIASYQYLRPLEQTPSFDGVAEWFNSPGMTVEELKGKPALLLFCSPTLDDSFCSAVVPYVKDWAATYADQGLVTIWIHTPYTPRDHNVSFEEFRNRSVRFNQKYGFTFPVAYDGNAILRDTFKIQAYPDFILMDKESKLYRPTNLPATGKIANYENYELPVKEIVGL